jgi:nitroimidazol reductase NimA-like FMN-containing flavoprotein (pyridoxamine 5'-phosphate oxidase superfamily)
MPDLPSAADSFAIAERTRLRRRPERGHYDKASVNGVLDAAMVIHLAWLQDGMPVCTPTGFWREADRLYWHGSAASRMIRSQSDGVPVCATVTHLDGIVLARSHFHHSVNYRSVMAFGAARLVQDEAEKRRAIDGFLDRFFPGRSASLRPPTAKEIKATSFVVMDIEHASAKIRSSGVVDDEEDYSLDIWSAVLPVRQVLGEAEICARLPRDTPQPPGIAPYRAGRALDEALLEACRLGG